MKSLKESSGAYLQALSKRSGQSRAYKSYQTIGLEVAEILEDFGHKSLYIKLAKEHGEDKILRIAKTVAEKKDVKNKGAYFMKVLQSSRE
ncbi:MAG: hypothetical protein AAB454_02040 [Patescibacteria group bacterium]